MFVQVNPDVTSYTETLSTLKFAERVSGVELGVARTSKEGKEGKDVRELMDQVKHSDTSTQYQHMHIHSIKFTKATNT